MIHIWFLGSKLFLVIGKLPSIRLAVPLFCFFLFASTLAYSGDAASVTSQKGTAVAEATAGAPVAEVPETVFDFGEVREGNEYVHAFKIRNIGTAVLEIKKVLPG
jgi:hypothetical protein